MKKCSKRIGLLFLVVIIGMLFTVSVSASECNSGGYDCVNGILFDGGFTIGDKGDGEATLVGLCDGYVNRNGVDIVYHDKLTSYTDTIIIPETVRVLTGAYSSGDYRYEDCKVVSIRGHAFWAENGIKHVSLPSTVNYIGESCFDGCRDIKVVDLPANLNEIWHRAFRDCEALEEINIPDNLTYIGSSAFENCKKLKEIYLPETLTGIGADAFTGTSNLKNVSIGMVDFTKIGERALYSEGIENITLTETVANIGKITDLPVHIFKSPNIKKVTVDEANPYYTSEDDVLFNKEKTELIYYPIRKEDKSYTIPDSVEKICSYSFHNENLEYVELPDNLKYIEERGFESCSNLKNISIIPNGIEKIAEKAFIYNSKLKDIYFNGTQYEWEEVKEIKNCAVYPNATIHFNGEIPPIIDPPAPEPEEPDEPDIPEIPSDHEHDYDDDEDEICNTCGYDRTENCNCRCHNDSFFAKIFWKITNFFNKLFKKNAICDCGIAHY